jgi:putative selenium metabolism hydrolase
MEKVIRYAQELIRTPSYSGKEGQIAHLIKQFLFESGIDNVFIDELGNVVGILRGSDDRSVVFVAHMDTVDVGDISQWKYHPFEGTLVDDKLVGRGAVDMKGSIASMIASIEMMGKSEDALTKYFLFTIHEETAEGVGIKHVFENFNINAIAAIIGEATGLNIAIGHRGRSVIDVFITGRSAHASMPQEGVNALEASSTLITKLIKYRSAQLPDHTLLGKATAVPTIIECSPKVVPQIPDKCRIAIDRRLIVNEDQESILSLYRRICAEIVDTGLAIECKAEIHKETLKCWTGRDIDALFYFPAWINRDDHIVMKLINGLKSVFPYTNQYVWKFSTDGVYTAGIAGIHTIGFGPGNEMMAHKPNEYVEVNQLIKAKEGFAYIGKFYDSLI